MRKISLSEEHWGVRGGGRGGGGFSQQEALKHCLHFARIYFFFVSLVGVLVSLQIFISFLQFGKKITNALYILIILKV